MRTHERLRQLDRQYEYWFRKGRRGERHLARISREIDRILRWGGATS